MEIAAYKKPEHITQLARDMRKNPTPAEAVLRKELRSKKLHGRKFHRQKPVFVMRENESRDRFIIADFYHHPSRLIIEVDGDVHRRPDIQEYDRLKEYLLTHLDYHILRYTNDEVIHHTQQVLSSVSEKIIQLHSL